MTESPKDAFYRLERELLGEVASAARRYVGETRAIQDIESWRKLKEALRMLDELRDKGVP